MTHMMTALYETRGAADQARQGLIGLGVADSAISIRGTDVAATGEVAPAEEKGFWESLGDMFGSDEDRSVYSEGMRRGGYLVSAEVDEDMTGQAEDVLERSDPIDVDERSATWRKEGWTGETTRTSGNGLNEAGTAGYAAAPATGSMAPNSADDKLQVVDEKLKVGKRQATGGSVRVRTYVTERPVEADVDLHSERVTVERHAVDREVAPGVAAFEDKTIEAVERSEEAVVSKTAHVTEEISLHKDVSDRTETVHDTVRETEVDIDDDTKPTKRDSSQL